LDQATDPDQLVFELDAALELANYMYVLFGDPVVLERAGRSINSSIERHLP
jgi:hypothetical protein